ncbi:signal peptidase I [Enterococcus sp. BWT-B8]|uniref:signal peptidase I n=1 Tax=Enterococcus sp. BWT-B8 TaxID=2885157 RepID=UPI001E562557|nr:signal peptidase I [Enterococcus sp. BWT-B8]MCB5951423.1 signal peptidase I [Enterococcus sp. BWT-B8]
MVKKRKQRLSHTKTKRNSKSAQKINLRESKKRKSGHRKTAAVSKNGKQRKTSNRKQPKRNYTKQKKRREGAFIKELMIALLIAAVLFGLLFWVTVRIPKIEGYSMTPTINDQDRLFVYKWDSIQRFKLLYFEVPETGEAMVRRVVGLPGEELYYKNGSLFINGEEIPERFLSSVFSEAAAEPMTEDFTLKEIAEVIRVPDDCYFVLGDNRLYATDSRYFGFVKKEDIFGLVKARIFPIHAMRQF